MGSTPTPGTPPENPEARSQKIAAATRLPLYLFGAGGDRPISAFFINPTKAAIDVTVEPFSGAGPLTPHTVRISTGPGRFKVAMRDWIGNVDHGTRVTGRTLGEEPVGIVVERTIT